MMRVRVEGEKFRKYSEKSFGKFGFTLDMPDAKCYYYAIELNKYTPINAFERERVLRSKPFREPSVGARRRAALDEFIP